VAQTPAPPKERIKGSKVNPVGSASSEEKAKGIKLSENIVESLKSKVAKFKKENPKKKNVTLDDAKAVMRRGMGAYSTSHRPTITGGKPNSRTAWGFARVNKFLKKAGGEKVKKAYVQDDDLLKMKKGGDIKKRYYYDDFSELQKAIYNETWSSSNVFIFKYPENSTAVIFRSYDGLSKNENEKIKEFYQDVNYDVVTKVIIESLGEEIAEKVLVDIATGNLVRFDASKESDLDSYNNILAFSQLNILYYRKGIEKEKNKKNLAPNGKPSNLNEEQYKLVRTKDFKNWFGDWEKDPKNSSQVVDENGEPLVVYRGDSSASKKGTIFKTGFNRMGYASQNRLPNQYLFYFTDKFHVANGYAVNGNEDHNTEILSEDKKVIIWYPKINSYFLNIRKPIDLTPNNPNFPSYKEYVKEEKLQGSYKTKEDKEIRTPYNYGYDLTFKQFENIIKNSVGEYTTKRGYRDIKYIERLIDRQNYNTWLRPIYAYFIENKKEDDYSAVLELMIDSIKERDFDGIVFLENTHYLDFEWENLEKDGVKYDVERWRMKQKVYGAFNSEQIKLADGTNTTFDGSNPDIRFEKGGEIITCENCGWSWKESQTTKKDKYICHKCGFHNKKVQNGYKRGGQTNKGLQSSIDTIGNVDHDPLDSSQDPVQDGMGVFKKGGMLTDEDKKETYSKWKDLINMSKSELKKFYDSKEGKEAGITIETASKLGISRGRTSAKWIMKMKDTPVAKWTPEMWKWANKQISFVSRMRGNKGDLYDDKGNKTRKHTSLLIWGHNPEKYNTGGMTNKKLDLEGYYAKGGEGKTCEVIRNGVRQIDSKSIEKLTDCVMKLPQTKELNTDEKGEYDPERKKLHKKIIYDIKKDLTCVQRKEPIAILMGGSPASGKSTFLKKYRPYLLSEEILKVDADEVRSKLPEYKGWNATQTHLETKDIVNLLLSDRNIGIPCAFDLIYDGTMNSTKSYVPLINLLKSLGYKVFIVYIDNVDQDIIKERALKRYQNSGRFVPLEVIDDFFTKGTAALESLKKMVDGYMVVDGSTSDYKVIERGGMQLPKDRNYSKIGTPIEVTEEEVVREYKKGGETDFDPDSKNIKGMITHKSGSAGGMLVGKRHSEGGIKAINKSTGQPLEMEGGEVVITRDAVSDDTKREFEGEMMTNREILSKINESGGGVSFADGGDIEECGCTGKKFNYGGKTMTDYEIVNQMKSLYPKDFAKGKKEEMSEHKGTFEKLRRKGLTASQAADLVVAEHLKKKPDYYKNYKEGGVLDVLGKKLPSMPSFIEVGEPVMTPFKGLMNYFYQVKDSISKKMVYREGGHIRGRKISDLMAYKTYIYDNFGINFSELPVRLQNALTLGNQKMIDDYLKE
jgi:predicted ABC-type ATPase